MTGEKRRDVKERVGLILGQCGIELELDEIFVDDGPRDGRFNLQFSVYISEDDDPISFSQLVKLAEALKTVEIYLRAPDEEISVTILGARLPA